MVTLGCYYGVPWPFVQGRDLGGAFTAIVTTIALGSRPRQKGCKVVGQEGARESLRMLPGVQESEGE